METPAVALPGEVDPFRVAELIAHKVQVGLAATSQGEEPRHLVQGNGPVDNRIVRGLIHVRIHGGIRQTENQGFVAHQRLVVAFHIGHCILSGAAHTHAAPHTKDVPVFVTQVPYGVNPHIRQPHTQPIVESDAAISNGQAHTGHARHIFGNGHGHRIHLTDHLVGQLQIGDGLCMGIVGEILVIGVEVRAQAVVVVEHGGDTIEAEAVKVVLGHPEFQIAQQEVDDAGLAVIKALGVPGRVIAFRAVVEELPSGAVEHIDALGGVLYGVGVHNVQQDSQAHLMGLIHQVFQIIRLSEPAGGSVEIGHLVAKTTIIGMLHNGHELDGVVTRSLDPGQHQVRKLPIGANLSFLLSHAHVSLVNKQGILPAEIAVCPMENLSVVCDLADPFHATLLLNNAAGVEGNVPGALHEGIYHSLYLAALPQSVVTWQKNLPVAVANGGQGMGGGIPIVEFSA